MPQTTAPTLRDPNGKLWYPTEHHRNGAVLYVIEGKDPATISPIVLSTRMELEAIFGTAVDTVASAA